MSQIRSNMAKNKSVASPYCLNREPNFIKIIYDNIEEAKNEKQKEAQKYLPSKRSHPSITTRETL